MDNYHGIMTRTTHPVCVLTPTPVLDMETKQASSGCYSLRKWVELPCELRDDLNRELSLVEMNQAAEDMQLTSSRTIVAMDARPTAVILIGAGGAGKTSILSRLPLYLPGFDPANFFLHDGDHLRRYHAGFQRSCCEAGVGYIGGWSTVKPHIRAAKADLITRAINERRNILIPTGQHAPEYVERMVSASYKVHIIGIFADCDTIMTRGVKRGHETGREYLGTVAMWEKASRDMLQIVRDVKPTSLTSGLAMLIDNRDFNNPAVLTVEQMRDILVASDVALDGRY